MQTLRFALLGLMAIVLVSMALDSVEGHKCSETVTVDLRQYNHNDEVYDVMKESKKETCTKCCREEGYKYGFMGVGNYRVCECTNGYFKKYYGRAFGN